jgi:hypothetical protein
VTQDPAPILVTGRFALAIAGESDLIVLDEPATAMDVEPGRRSGRPRLIEDDPAGS